VANSPPFFFFKKTNKMLKSDENAEVCVFLVFKNSR
jgi:hypothetical protein